MNNSAFRVAKTLFQTQNAQKPSFFHPFPVIIFPLNGIDPRKKNTVKLHSWKLQSSTRSITPRTKDSVRFSSFGFGSFVTFRQAAARGVNFAVLPSRSMSVAYRSNAKQNASERRKDYMKDYINETTGFLLL